MNGEIIEALCHHFSISEAKEILEGKKKIKLEIGERLLRAIEKLITHNENILSSSKREWSSDPVETTGDAIRKAFGIDFIKIAKGNMGVGPLEIFIEEKERI
jgi:hypothetical protein